MYWFYQVPDWILLPAFTIVFVLASLGMVLIVRPFIHRMVTQPEQWDRALGYTSYAFGVVFGILLALVALSVYEDYTEAHAAALAETSQLAGLYRGTNGLPGELGGEMRDVIRDYLRIVIDVDWPEQAAGVLPDTSGARVDQLEQLLYSFDPQTLQDDAKFSQLLSTFDDFIEARRVRIDAATLQLPGMFWFVIWIGAAVNAMLIALVFVNDVRLHLVLAGMLGLFVALVIFITADMDHPYAGSISVGPDDFKRVLEIFSP